MGAVGLFGGEFDPVHNNHVRVARAALAQARLARLLVVPNARPPHRARALAPVAERLEMLRIALGDEPGVEVSGAESGAEREHYTVDTVAWLRGRFPGDTVAVVVGADAVAALDGWRRWRELAATCGWLVAPRAGLDFLSAARPAVLAALGGAPVPPAEVAPGRAALLDVAPSADSSTDVRARLGAGGDAGAMLPPGVLRHIRGRGLYGCHA